VLEELLLLCDHLWEAVLQRLHGGGEVETGLIDTRLEKIASKFMSQPLVLLFDHRTKEEREKESECETFLITKY
jgi:hypothetical protein